MNSLNRTNVFTSIRSLNLPSSLINLIPNKTSHRVALGIGILASVALAFWTALRNQNTPPEFTYGQNGENFENQFYVLNGYANPANRCAKILARVLPGRVFAGNPRHVFPFFAQARNTDRPGIEQFANSPTTANGKKILVGHSCGAVDVLNHVIHGTLPEGIDAVIAVSPFAHTNNIADAYVPNWAPHFVRRCLRSVVGAVLVKFRDQQPIVRLNQNRERHIEPSERLKYLPILILGCRGDIVVPSGSTEHLGLDMKGSYPNTDVVISEKPDGWYSFSVHDHAATTATNVAAINDFISGLG
jgi:hypothetical protein